MPVRNWPHPGAAAGDLAAYLGGAPMSVGIMQKWSQGLGSYGRRLNPRAAEFVPGLGWF